MVEAFAGTITLRVESGGAEFADAPDRTERFECLGLKTAALISKDFIGRAELQDPLQEESTSDRRGILKLERNRYCVLSEKINDSEPVAKAFRGHRERFLATDNVKSDELASEAGAQRLQR